MRAAPAAESESAAIGIPGNTASIKYGALAAELNPATRTEVRIAVCAKEGMYLPDVFKGVELGNGLS